MQLPDLTASPPSRASTSSSLSPFEIGSNRKQSSRANCGIRAPVRARLQPTNSKRAVRFVRPCKGREIKTAFSPRILTPVGDSTPRPVTARCADVDHYNASQNRLTSGRRRSFTIRVTIKYIDERIPRLYAVVLAERAIRFCSLFAPVSSLPHPHLRSLGPFPARLTTGCRITVFHFYVGV